MSDETSKHSFEIDLEQVEQAVADLVRQLTAMEHAFASTGANSSSHLREMDAASRQAAGGMEAAASSGQRMGLLGTIFSGAAGGVLSLVHALAEASHFAFLIPNSLGTLGTALGALLGRVTPLGPAMVGAFSNALPAVRSALNHVALLDTGIKTITGRLSLVGSALGVLQARTVGVGTGWALIGGVAAYATSTMVAAGRAGIAAMSSLTSAAVSSAGAIGTAFLPLAVEFAPLIALFAALAVAGKGISSAANFESMRTSFRTLVGDVAVADAAIKDLSDFADVTPFETEEVTEAGRNLVAFGFDAKTLKPILNDIGDLAAGSNKKLEDVGRAFGRIKSGDFGEAFERLRDFGISRADLEGQGLTFDKGGSYKGTVDAALTGVRAVIREKFGGSMQDLSQTWSGLWSTLLSKGAAGFREFGSPIMEAVKPVLTQLISMMDSLMPLFAEIGTALAGAFQLALPVIVWVFDRVRDMIGELVELMRSLNQLFGFKPIIPANPTQDRGLRKQSDDTKKPGSEKEPDYGTSNMRQHGLGGTAGVAGIDPMLDEARRGTELAAQQLSVLQEIRNALPSQTPAPQPTAHHLLPLAFAS